MGSGYTYLRERSREARGARKLHEYTAIVKRAGDWLIGWLKEVPCVDCQERSREELLEVADLPDGLDLDRCLRSERPSSSWSETGGS